MIAAVCPVCNYREVLPDHADGNLQICHSCGLPRGIHAVEQNEQLEQAIFHAPPVEWMEVPLLQWDEPRPNAKPEPLPEGFVCLGKPPIPEPKPVYPPLPELPAEETTEPVKVETQTAKTPTTSEPQPVAVPAPAPVPVAAKQAPNESSNSSSESPSCRPSQGENAPAEARPGEPRPVPTPAVPAPRQDAPSAEEPHPMPVPAPHPKLRFACNGCGVQFKVSAEKAGKKGKCPRCGTPYIVPGTPKPKPSKPRATVPAHSAATNPQPQRQIYHRCRRCRTPLMSAESLAGMVDTCPACGGATPVPSESILKGHPNLPRTRRTSDSPRQHG